MGNPRHTDTPSEINSMHVFKSREHTMNDINPITHIREGISEGQISRPNTAVVIVSDKQRDRVVPLAKNRP